MIHIRYIEPKRLHTKQEILVSFEYKKEIVDVIRLIPERYYDANSKSWHLSYDALSFLKENLPQETFHIIGSPINDKQFGEKLIKKDYSLPNTLKTKLFGYQKEGFNILMNYDKYLLLDSQGLGKAISSITVSLKQKELYDIKHCLVVCGVNSIKYNWQNEISIHAGMKSSILGNRQNKKGKWQVKSNSDKLDDLENIDNLEFFIITNIETLRDKVILDKLKKLIKKGEIEIVICDEIHACRSISASQSKGLLSIAKLVKYFYGLTGTVLTNNPLDAYVPLRCVDGTDMNYTNFKYRYCTFGGFGGYQIVGYKHLDELQYKLAQVSIRRTKEDVLDLPPKIYKIEYVELGSKQRKIYNDVLDFIMKDIDNITLNPSPLSQLTRLRQVTADTSIVSSTVNESAKYERLDEILEELNSNNEKAVIFSNWTTITNSLYSRYKKYNPAIITGEIKDNKREEEKNRFMNDKDCKILIGTIAAMGVGLTLTAATTAIFVDEPYTFSAYEQSSDRIYRIGQTKNVTIISLIAKDTIDERIHKIMMRKKNIGDAIVDHKFDLRNKDTLLWLLGD